MKFWKMIMIGLVLGGVIGMMGGHLWSVYAVEEEEEEERGFGYGFEHGIKDSFGRPFKGTGEQLVKLACQAKSLESKVRNFVQDLRTVTTSGGDLITLTKNSCLRNLIWGVEDQRMIFMNQIEAIEKQQCLDQGNSMIGNTLPPTTSNAATQLQLDLLITKRDRFWDAYDYLSKFALPVFSDINREKIPTDQLFGYTAISEFMNLGDEASEFFMKDLPESFQKFAQDLGGCGESDLYFAYLFNDFSWKFDSTESFIEYLEREENRPLVEQGKKMCRQLSRDSGERTTDFRQQKQKFVTAMENLVQRYSTRASEIIISDPRISRELRKEYIQLQADIAYRQFLIAQVGSCGSTFEPLAKKLKETVESVLNVDETIGRMSIADRLEDAKARRFQRICGRLATMYVKTGRDLTALPRLGTANGRVYCAPSDFICEEDTLAECLFGKKEMEFNDRELENARRNLENPSGQDLQNYFEQQSLFMDLTKRRDHLQNFRQELKGLYSSTDFGGSSLVSIVRDTTASLREMRDGEEQGNYDPSKDKVTPNQVSILKYLYENIWTFGNMQVVGSCPAPKKPK